MTEWYVKDLSKLTGVSVQTLHHYDRIDLLKPSLRADNGYRVYGPKDLLKLQQIVALKFFGFNLSQIKSLLAKNVDMVEHFAMQSQFLEEEAQTLLKARDILKNVVASVADNQISWENILRSIEVYKMTQQLENTWVAKVFDRDEMDLYANYQADLKKRYSEAELESMHQRWRNLIKQISENLQIDPTSAQGDQISQNLVNMLDEKYGEEYAALKYAVWEKGLKQAKVEGNHLFTPEVVAWIDKALDAYWRKRIYALLDRAVKPSPQLLAEWNALLRQMYGNIESRKEELVQAAMIDARVSDAARQWLRSLC